MINKRKRWWISETNETSGTNGTSEPSGTSETSETKKKRFCCPVSPLVKVCKERKE